MTLARFSFANWKAAILPCAVAASVMSCPASARAQDPTTNSEILAELKALRTRVDELESRLAKQEDAKSKAVAPSPSPPPASGGKQPVADLDADAIDAEFMGTTGIGDRWYDRTSIGGYGEMHLQLGDEEQIDFHRWVLFVNHQFNERIKLYSELELEHSLSGDGKPGEVELEQAYIDFGITDRTTLKGGLFLLPVGMLNETHEPATFFGTERNPIEKETIPTTWWEGGAGLTHATDTGLQFDLVGHSGLAVPSTGSNAFRIRSGRQKVAEADASEWAATSRIRYTGIPGLELAASGQYQSDITPGVSGEKNDALFGTAHVNYRLGGFGLRALGGYWDIDGPTPRALGRDEQWGYFVEPSYTFTLPDETRLGIFARYNEYSYAGGDVTQYDLGLNYWPHENVVLKADFSRIDTKGAGEDDVFNFGIGYQF